MKLSVLIKILVRFLLMLLMFIRCSEEDQALISYTGQERSMSDVVVESGILKPKITWVGGFASVLGVNKGNTAVLDSSLIWLVKMDEDNIRYPVTFGEIPAGAVDLTSQYGGTSLNVLEEDETYTFWILKNNLFENIPTGIPIKDDPTLGISTVKTENDTVYVTSQNHTQGTITIDLYVNLDNIKQYGKLARIDVEQPKTSNNPTINWTITQSDTLDSLVSAIGIIEGQQYVPTRLIWEVWSEEFINGESVLGKKNIIAPPVLPGDQFSESRVFAEYPSQGLERDKDYYIWIANKYWDGKGRSRITNFYAYVTFHTY